MQSGDPGEGFEVSGEEGISGGYSGAGGSVSLDGARRECRVDVKSREVDARKRLENKGFLRRSRFWTWDNTPGKWEVCCQRKHIYMKKWHRVE